MNSQRAVRGWRFLRKGVLNLQKVGIDKTASPISATKILWPHHRYTLPSGVATGVARGQSATPDSKNLPKIGKKYGKIGKKRKNQEEKAKIGKFLSLCPSWQIGLAMLLTLPPYKQPKIVLKSVFLNRINTLYLWSSCDSLHFGHQ